MVVEQLLKDNATEVCIDNIDNSGVLSTFNGGQSLNSCLIQGELLGYMEKACQLIPDEGLASQCKEIVDDYFPILMGIIQGELVS